MVKTFMGKFQLRNWYENVTKLLSALCSWTYSFIWPCKYNWCSLGLHVSSHQCFPPGVGSGLPSLTRIWQDPTFLSPSKVGGLCDLLWPVTCEWEHMCHFLVDSLRVSVWFPPWSSPLCWWWWVKLKPLSARDHWVISMSNIFTFIINEKSRRSKEMFLWRASVK